MEPDGQQQGPRAPPGVAYTHCWCQTVGAFMFVFMFVSGSYLCSLVSLVLHNDMLCVFDCVYVFVCTMHPACVIFAKWVVLLLNVITLSSAEIFDLFPHFD